MKDDNMTKEQFINELAILRQRNIELEVALKDQDRISTVPAWTSPNRQFSTGRVELFVADPSRLKTENAHLRKYHFSDLVDIPRLQNVLNSFYMATGIPHGLYDCDNNLLSKMGWQDICTQFHCVCPQTECWCQQSKLYVSAHLGEGPYVGHMCINGLMEYAAPIILEGQHLATIYLGQFLHKPPDEEYFRRQAQTYGFDEANYMSALFRIPIIPKPQVERIMDFYSQVGKILASIGLERKRQLAAANQTISEQENRLGLILETSNDGFWELDIVADTIYLSPRWVEILGYSPGELEPYFRSVPKLLHPDDNSAVLKAFAAHKNDRTAKIEVEFRMLTKSGEWKWVMARGQTVVRNVDGKSLRMVGTIIDITDRRQAELALLQSEEKFYKAFHRNPDLMSISTLSEGRYIEVNDAFVEITGYERHEVIGRTNLEVGIWVEPEQRNIVIEQVQEHGSIRNIETQYRLKSGEIRNFNISVEKIDIEGEAHLIVTTRDITEPKKMEEALRLSEECLSKAFDTSPIIMTITTLDGGRFIKANNAFCRIWGYSHEEVVDHSSIELGFWSNSADRDLVVKKIIAKQPVRDMEIVWCKKSGEQRLGLYSAEGLEINGQPCILSVLTDITDLRQMEVEMTRLDRLNLVGEMAASIGHEIRNPMTIVRGYLQLLRENKDYVQEIDYFDLMIEELDRANSIITEFLSLAKNKIVDMTPRNINSIISKSLPLIQVKAMSKDHIIKLDLAELPDLLLDQKEIRQLILNMVNNGLESMLTTGEVAIRTFIEKEKVVLAVQDKGHGIDRELLDKLGTPFFTTKDQGTGLGLAVCYRIANRHNAKIDVETSSTGTTFYVRFPIPVPALSVG